jgi:predicted nucleic acid-binding protein
VASLIDTNLLVYRFDPRDPVKQAVAARVLRAGLAADALVLPHQAVIEFVAAVARPRSDLGSDLGGTPLLTQAEAREEAESLMQHFPLVFPNRAVVTEALRGMAAYGLSWFDAHLWAHAEVFGIPEILSEDFEHGRYYGSVRVNDPFLTATGQVQELPPLYAVNPG